ncbi:MAG: BppU family phage baseplate upper protein [Clostridia bacterium]|nr:BppU family phage baseplate upper protein [Clostridia bacterium]
MSYSIFRFTLNMHNHRSQASVKVFKGDTAVKLIITLTDGGNIYKIVRGCTATLTGTKPNGEKLKHSCSIEGDTIIYIFDNETADQAGLATCEITLYDENGRVITAPKFTMDVAEKEVEGSEPISEYSSAAIATVMGAAAKEYARQEAEEARQANEEQRQESYNNAETTAAEAKTISQEAKSIADSAVSTSLKAKETAANANATANHALLAVDSVAEQADINATNIEYFFDTASLTYDNQTGILNLSFDTNDDPVTVSVNLPLESSIVSIDEVEQDNKIYLKLTLASGNETLIELDDIIRGFVSKETFDAKISELTNAINGVEESLRQLNEGGIV